jgi:adenine C2-methylase RlmN of 23S rRNA A2503 and tRNA A37
MDKKKALQKWSPVLENIGIKNLILQEYIAIWAENYVLQNPNVNDLPEKMAKLLSKLQKIRQEVVKTYYNPISGAIEYELSNGLVVNEENRFKNELTQENLIDLFGIDFTRELDVEEFRENRLNGIING